MGSWRSICFSLLMNHLKILDINPLYLSFCFVDFILVHPFFHVFFIFPCLFFPFFLFIFFSLIIPISAMIFIFFLLIIFLLLFTVFIIRTIWSKNLLSITISYHWLVFLVRKCKWSFSLFFLKWIITTTRIIHVLFLIFIIIWIVLTFFFILFIILISIMYFVYSWTF